MTVSLFALAAAALSQAQAPSGSPVDPAMGVPVASSVEALPEPERDPLRIDIAADPILGLARESAPDDQVCWTGDVTQAKKILWAMLFNTDGNGDHWLDEGATITGSAGQTIEVEYSVTGEGGPTPRALSVPVCP